MKDEGRILSANSLRPSSFVLCLVLKNLIPIQLNQCPNRSSFKMRIAIKSKVWDTYHAADAKTFMENINAFQIWAKDTLPDGTALDAILKLCGKSPKFLLAYEYPSACRTSNLVLSVAERMVDRHINAMDRYLDSCQYYHGHLMSAEYSIRAWALLHNLISSMAGFITTIGYITSSFQPLWEGIVNNLSNHRNRQN